MRRARQRSCGGAGDVRRVLRGPRWGQPPSFGARWDSLDRVVFLMPVVLRVPLLGVTVRRRDSAFAAAGNKVVSGWARSGPLGHLAAHAVRLPDSSCTGTHTATVHSGGTPTAPEQGPGVGPIT